MATSNQEQIAKDIVIALLEKGGIILPGKASYDSYEQMEEFNEKRAKAIGNFYRIILEAVEKGTSDEKFQGPFEIT